MSDRTGRTLSDLVIMSSVDVAITAGTVVDLMSSTQELCDALVQQCAEHDDAARVAAALVLLASVDDDLELDLDAVPQHLRAIFNDA
ncbi:MAG TPA: hypothetical protein VGF99_16795 [Myxococcota bacterium]